MKTVVRNIEIERKAKKQIMSVQFGRWNFDGQPPAPAYIDQVSATLARYGPDSNEMYAKGGVTILYRAFHTTKESHHEVQPHVSPSGAVITWDGRLDNRRELIGELSSLLRTNAATAQSGGNHFARMNSLQAEPGTSRATAQSVAANFPSVNSVHESTDVEIAAGAYEKWGAECFGRLIGDWALSIWNPCERSVLLAKDPIGTKHLYYSIEKDQASWSTILDPLVLFAGPALEICEEYVAGWFSYFPAAHLTPYVGIRAVPMSSSVLLRPGKQTITKYWDFNPGKRIRYRSDAEYEEHFRTVFAQAVQRRLRSDRPVLAELSGGLDSSSIVCVADLVLAQAQNQNATPALNITPNSGLTPRLDTISWYDDSFEHIEPDSNERRYFSKIEEKRGRTGCHIILRSLRKDGSSQISLASDLENSRLAVIPLSNRKLSEHYRQYAAYMLSQGHRITLSGIGGDTVTGGDLPTPRPELQNLLAKARFVSLARQLNAWAAKMGKPRLPLLWEAARGFFTPALTGAPIEMRLAPWFNPGFIRRNHIALGGYPSKLRMFGSLPSFQENVVALNALRRQLANVCLHSHLLREVRFPYLDRDFLEFLYAVPREQIVGVGKRRFLMKRALAGIVPNEVLNRRRKAFVPQESTKDSATQWPNLTETGQQIVGSSLGIIDPNQLFEALQRARRNEECSIGLLRRTLMLEFWLRHLQRALGDKVQLASELST
jgi:asparagine synthase (glutamine-hydrolysing)